MTQHIVVGAGASGCIMARRLVDAGRRVLLIEAGEMHRHPSNVEDVEGFTNLWNTRFDWALTTVRQKGLANRKITVNQGKIVGGSSAINAMMYVRCHSSDYEHLERRGGQRWSLERIRDALSRIENYVDGPREGRFQTGMVQVRDCPDPACYSPEFQQSAAALGFAADDWDYNGPHQENGAGPLQFNIDGQGRRHSAFNAYLEEILDSPLLEVRHGCEALRIVLGADDVATGVEVRTPQGDIETLRSDQDIILCAGALLTPLLLQRSGIGPSRTLEKAGVPPKVELPAVGEHLMDHLQLPVIYRLKKEIPNPRLLTGNVLFLNLNNNSPWGAPDLQLNFTPAAPRPLQRLLPPLGGPVLIFLPILVQPVSVGRVRLGAKQRVELDPHYLSHRKDVDVLVKAVEFCRQMVKQPGLEALAGDPLLPDEADLETYVRGNASTLWHPVGTCRLGSDPKESVVDARLQVHGVGNLRVADASVTPYATAGYNHVPTMVIAEMAADFLLSGD